MTANQVIAYNLRRAREDRRWTQERAARELERYLGRRWSNASFSAAERSAEDGRVRVFDANEVLAFARAFGEPIGFFFTPPEGVDYVECGTEDSGRVAKRVVSRDELRAAALPRAMTPDVFHGHLATLRHIVNEFERADEAALREQAQQHEEEER